MCRWFRYWKINEQNKRTNFSSRFQMNINFRKILMKNERNLIKFIKYWLRIHFGQRTPLSRCDWIILDWQLDFPFHNKRNFNFGLPYKTVPEYLRNNFESSIGSPNYTYLSSIFRSWFVDFIHIKRRNFSLKIHSLATERSSWVIP